MIYGESKLERIPYENGSETMNSILKITVKTPLTKTSIYFQKHEDFNWIQNEVNVILYIFYIACIIFMLAEHDGF